LFVTVAENRIGNIREAARALPANLHPYYRLGYFPKVVANPLGPVWVSRDKADQQTHALVTRNV